MDWQLAIEKNREALKSILVMLVAMAGLPVLLGRGDAVIAGDRPKTLPRHLHRFVLRLLRPAEAAARRLIIIAARGLVVELSPPRQRKPKPQSIFVRAGAGTGIVRVGSLRDRTLAASRAVSLPLFDPLKRFGGRRRYVKPGAVPRIRSFDDARVPLSSSRASRTRRRLLQTIRLMRAVCSAASKRWPRPSMTCRVRPGALRAGGLPAALQARGKVSARWDA